MIVTKLIDWQPIASLPDDRKDGRLMLLWSPAGGTQLGYWDGKSWASDLGYQRYPGGEWEAPVFDKEGFVSVAYWADINPPE